MWKWTFGTSKCVFCKEVISIFLLFSEGPLLAVPLYYQLIINIACLRLVNFCNPAPDVIDDVFCNNTIANAHKPHNVLHQLVIHFTVGAIFLLLLPLLLYQCPLHWLCWVWLQQLILHNLYTLIKENRHAPFNREMCS